MHIYRALRLLCQWTYLCTLDSKYVVSPSTELLESISDTHPLRNRLLGLLIHFRQLRHKFKHLTKKLARNGHYSLQRVTKDDISLEYIATIRPDSYHSANRTKLQTHRRNSNTPNGDRHITSTSLSLSIGSHSRSSPRPDLFPREKKN